MNYFKVFSNCIVTRGAKQSLISDLQREVSEFIPNSMAEIIEELNSNISINNIFEKYGKENEEIILEYINFLHKKDMGFYCDENDLDRFPALNLKFLTSSFITNTVIECSHNNIFWLQKILKSLDSVQCRNVCLVFYEHLDYNDYLKISSLFNNSIVENVEIIVKYRKDHDTKVLEDISKSFIKLSKVVFFGSPKQRIIYQNNSMLMDVVFLKSSINNFSFCGGVKTENFNTNITKVLEAKNYNSCLHKKMSIDSDGNIRNCPSMPQSFGNIKDTTLEEALNHKDFKKYWNLTKDKIEVCKDCEFRYICTDCRAYTEKTYENKERLDISKPLKCGYNPYTGEWEEWSTNPLKEKAIKYYGMQDLVKKN